MKRLVFCISLLCAMFAHGQKHRISVNYMPSITNLGKQTQSFDHYYFRSRKGNTTFNNAASVLYSNKIFSKLTLTTGFEFSQQGQNIAFKTNGGQAANEEVIFWSQLDYCRLPVTIGYSFIQNKKYELSVYSGVNVGFATKRSDNYQDIILESILLAPAEQRYRKQDWAIPVGLDCERMLTKRTSVIAGVQYLIGLTNSFSNNGSARFGVLSAFDNSRQNRLSLRIGIGIYFK